ncbi:MAG TPA: hypothetical protein VFG02_03980 [Nitrospirota bacterium]|nr:hypothetical protein [Nitrospirota bacterium]
MRYSWVYIGSAVLLAAFLSGCAQKGPVLLDNIRYQAPEGLAAGAPKLIVGVSPFKDDRGKTFSVIGKRTIPDYMENDLVVQGTVADLVTAGLKDALKARGIMVKDAPAWDMNAESIKSGGIDILIGGEIKTLWVEAVSQPLNAKVNAVVQLRVSAAEAAEKKIIRTLVLNSKLERKDVAFSFELVEDAVSEALSSALNQLLNDEEFKKKIR